MRISRRQFVVTSVAAGLESMVSGKDAFDPTAGSAYPGWREGEMDLHFIYTGCGENMFFRFPDGTSMVHDVGEFYRPRDLKDVPLLPSDRCLGGDWVSRYIQRVYPEKTIDYAVLSHWHSDHVGHARWDRDGKLDGEPNGAFRWRETADGRKINGFLCVAEDFRFRRYFDHQYPARGTYDSHDSSLDLLSPWVERERARGLVVEPFRPGALNQIRLLRKPGAYRDSFSIRNICANGVVWDGKDGTIDYAAQHRTVCADPIGQNILSLGFVVRYGKFSFFTGGDVQLRLRDGDGWADYEGIVGLRAGPVTVCKMNHHGCSDSMSESFVRAVRAQAYVSCVWCPSQLNASVLARLASRRLHPDCNPMLFPNLIAPCHEKAFANKPFWSNIKPRGAVHVVVKVLPGGEFWRVYLLDAHDETMQVLAMYESGGNQLSKCS